MPQLPEYSYSVPCYSAEQSGLEQLKTFMGARLILQHQSPVKDEKRKWRAAGKALDHERTRRQQDDGRFSTRIDHIRIYEAICSIFTCRYRISATDISFSPLRQAVSQEIMAVEISVHTTPGLLFDAIGLGALGFAARVVLSYVLQTSGQPDHSIFGWHCTHLILLSSHIPVRQPLSMPIAYPRVNRTDGPAVGSVCTSSHAGANDGFIASTSTGCSNLLST
ncbi:hypothetical protein WG66_009063 [Moniliophthora roreri]|nr:hypothetical protein WG66_009063 [Moniliophthora roreri]